MFKTEGNTGISEFVTQDRISSILVDNSNFSQIFKNKIAAKRKEYNLSYWDLENDVSSDLKLTKKIVKEEFSETLGGLITGANGYRASHYKDSPIVLHEGLFKELENAEGIEDIAAAIVSLYSVLIHEYMEEYTDDELENPRTGETFGAYKAQEQIFFTTNRPGYWKTGDTRDYLESAKEALEELKEHDPESYQIIMNQAKEIANAKD